MPRAKNLFIRALPATFLAGALFGVSVTSLGAAFRASAIFRDVPSSHYADEAIGEMYQLGIIKGYDSTHF
nr:S-layer homology domain-containing protein [Candidatus Peribacteraceae bacterium]